LQSVSVSPLQNGSALVLFHKLTPKERSCTYPHSVSLFFALLVAQSFASQQQAFSEAWFDTSAFARQSFGAFGTTGRNIIFADGAQNLDLAVIKRTHFGKEHNGKAVEFRSSSICSTIRSLVHRISTFLRRPLVRSFPLHGGRLKE